MPNKKKTVLQREEELAQRIMQEVNAGIEAKFKKFERVMERMAAITDQQPSTEPLHENNKRQAEQTAHDDSPPRKVSKTNSCENSRSILHSTFPNNDNVPLVDLAGTPVRTSPASPSHKLLRGVKECPDRRSSPRGYVNKHGAMPRCCYSP